MLKVEKDTCTCSVAQNEGPRVGKGRADHDATVTQCNATTVEMIPDENTNVTIANADVKHMYSKDASAKENTNNSTWEHGINEDDEQDTWVQVVDRRRKKRTNEVKIVSRSTLSRNNPVI